MTRTSSIGLHPTTLFDNWKSQGARTRDQSSQKEPNFLPPGISEIAHDVACASGSTTEDGGAILTRGRSRIVLYIGRALLFNFANIADIPQQHEETGIDGAPHLEAVRWIKEATGFSQKRIAQLIGVSRMTLNLWERGQNIAEDNRRRLFAAYDVLKRAQKRHNTSARLVAWLDTPRGADGHTPAQLLEAGEIDRARVMAMTTPSSKVIRPASWVGRPIPPAYQKGAERLVDATAPDNDDELFEHYGDPGMDQDD